MIVIEAVGELPPTKAKTIRVFLAGGISNTNNWQKEVIDLLANRLESPYIKRALVNKFGNDDPERIVIFNPRRENFPIDDPKAAEEQITWEFNKLKTCDIVSFWFAPETLNPIVLYELGFQNNGMKSIVVGCHPDYKRKADVEIQTKLSRPDVKIVYSLSELVDRIVGKIITMDV